MDIKGGDYMQEPETYDKRITRLELQMESIEKKLNAIDDNTLWIRRLVTGTVITTIIGGIGTYIFWLIQNQ